MSTVFKDINKILDTKLKALPSDQAIAWPNTVFKPHNVTQYLRPTLILGETDMYTLNDVRMLPGIYQIDIYGQADKGIGQVNTLADEIYTYFNATKQYDEGSTKLFIQGVSLGQAERQDAWWTTYIQINFIAFN